MRLEQIGTQYNGSLGALGGLITCMPEFSALSFRVTGGEGGGGGLCNYSVAQICTMQFV